ncbi:uncharacterized protein LOC110899580 [Helianthus annuus]|uniref:uncharacterized protein LOC110899580 n=1 Tax=Helianthus annuus TaxID=4232 RepID=UPI000B8F0506|nr:uncharacterized protein LOC110899580 [Helianthus annuus]
MVERDKRESKNLTEKDVQRLAACKHKEKKNISAKLELWNDLQAEFVNAAGFGLLAGDFNSVRYSEERRNSAFKPGCARNFNNFIHILGLLEYNLVGNQFSCVRDNGRKLSKIDRFLVCPNFFNKWPEASVRVLHNLYSDHRPLVLSTNLENFGHKPFRFFNSWLGKDGLEEVVKSAAESFSFSGDPDLFLSKKLAFIRSKIKNWRDEMVKKEGEEERSARADLERLEEIMESKDLSEDEEWTYAECNKILKDLSSKRGEDLKQRSRIKWAIDGDENSNFLMGLLEFFYKEGRLNVGCNSSFITLVPKIKDPVDLNNYRPINLVGVISKVVSKILANRLKTVIGKVVSNSQSAFIKGKYILDGPLIVNEIIAWCKRNKKKMFLLKIDFEKAYDNVNWHFVIDIMLQIGFPDLWCKWLWGILSSARSSVLVNGSPTFEFKCEKGMRQCDPISPFIFLLVMEALSCLMDKALEEGIFQGIKIPNGGPCNSHLLYADDALILGDWSSENVKNVVRILRIFYLCSGLKINLWKSNLYAIGVEGREVEDQASLVGCKADNFLFRYLGIMVGANMSNINNWNRCMTSSKLGYRNGRPNPSQSVVGLCSLSLFLKASLPIISRSTKLRLKLLRTSKVSVPKDFGGIGLCKLRDINLALLSKWCWRFEVEQNFLWCKVVNAIHYNPWNWDFLPFKKNMGGPWNKLVKWVARTMVDGIPLRSFFRGVPGKGDNIAFWLDPWVSCDPLKDMFPNLFHLETNRKVKISERIMIGSDCSRFFWQWKRPLESVSELDDLSKLSALLDNFHVSDSADKWVWIGNGLEDFSVGGVKKALVKGNCPVTHSNFSWCKWLPAKCNVFAWRADLGRIPTVDALRIRNVNISESGCGFCNEGEDSVSHFFTECYVANVIWNSISRWCKVRQIYVFSFQDLLKAHDFCGLKDPEKNFFYGVIIIACWCIWKARNEARFRNRRFRIEKILSDVKSYGFLWARNRSKYKNLSWENWCKFVIM